MTELNQQVQEHIGNGLTKKAITLLLVHVEDEDSKQQILILSARFENIRRKMNKGVTTSDEMEIEENQINIALLMIAEQLRGEDIKKSPLPQTVSAPKSSGFNFYKMAFFFGILLFVLILGVSVCTENPSTDQPDTAQATLPASKTIEWEHQQTTFSVPADFEITLSNNDVFKAQNVHIYLEISLSVPLSQNPDVLKIINKQAMALKKGGTVEAPQKLENVGATAYMLVGTNYDRKFYQILVYDKTKNLIVKFFMTYTPDSEETAQQILNQIDAEEKQ